MASLWHFPAPGCAHIPPRRSWCCGEKEFLLVLSLCWVQYCRVSPPPCLCPTSSTRLSGCCCCCGPVCAHNERSACSHHLWHGGEAGGEPPFSIAIVASALLPEMSFPLGRAAQPVFPCYFWHGSWCGACTEPRKGVLYPSQTAGSLTALSPCSAIFPSCPCTLCIHAACIQELITLNYNSLVFGCFSSSLVTQL